MSVFSIWESRFPPAAAAEGREATEAIWRDMPGFDGYLRHVLVEDLDEPGHLLVVGEWESRETADRAATSTPPVGARAAGWRLSMR